MLSLSTITTLYPRTAPTMARPIPVFPLVGSMMVPPGFRSSRLSASRTMLIAIRSFTLPPGLNCSSLA